MHELAIEFLALANRQRDVATALDVGFPQDGTPAPERVLAWLIQATVQDVAPPPPQYGIRGTLPDVTQLPMAAEGGQARVWVAYRGTALTVSGGLGWAPQPCNPFKTFQNLARVRYGHSGEAHAETGSADDRLTHHSPAD